MYKPYFNFFFTPHFYTNTIFGNTTFIYPTFFTDIYIIFTPTFFVPTLFKSSLLLFFLWPPLFFLFFTSLEPLRHGPVHAAKKSQKVKIINYFLMVIFNVFLGKKKRGRKRSTYAVNGPPRHKQSTAVDRSTQRFFQEVQLIIFSFTVLS